MLDIFACRLFVRSGRARSRLDAFPAFLRRPPMNDTVLLTRDGPVATLTLNRPNDLNVLDHAMVDALVAHTTTIAGDDSLRVVVLRGAGPHFMAGGDIRSFAARLGEAPAARSEGFARLIGRLHAAIEHLHRMPHPVVGRVHGAVAGFGLSLMNACDLVVAADDAYFASAYRQIALTPDGGGSWSLPRLVGMRKAMEIFLLGERFGAAEALSLGIVNRVVPAAELDAATNAIVHALATGPVLALRNAKRLVRESLARTLSEQLDAEAASFAACAGTADFVEGITAFLAKRPPQFGRMGTTGPWARAANDADLAGKTLFITGGSRGIGLAIALRAAREGANVAIAAKTVEPHPKLPGTIHSAAAAIDAGGRPRVADCLRHP